MHTVQHTNQQQNRTSLPFSRGSSSNNWSLGPSSSPQTSSHILNEYAWSVKQKTEIRADTLSVCVGYWAAISASSFEKYSFLIKLSIKHWVLRILLTSNSLCTLSKVTKDVGTDSKGAWGRLSALPISWPSMAMTERCCLFHIHLWKVGEVWHKGKWNADSEHNLWLSSALLGLQTAHNIHSIQYSQNKKKTHSSTSCPLFLGSTFVDIEIINSCRPRGKGTLHCQKHNSLAYKLVLWELQVK